MKKINITKINWKKVNGLIPAIIQNSSTGQVLMLGYMNQEALKKTIDSGCVWFFSRTKNRLWMKGETSKYVLRVASMKLDCDNDTILIKAIPEGPTCHTGENTCFAEKPHVDPIAELYATIYDRKQTLPKGSYTTSLFKNGLDKISLKVAEEALEVVHAAQKQTPKRVLEESVDLLYHLFVLLVEKKIDLKQIEAEILKRGK